MIDFIIGDICKVHVDAIVNPTDTQLSGSGGADKAIHTSAGNSLRDECRKAGVCPVGQTVLTRGGNLSAKYVIHTAVPKWGNNSQDAEYLLAACYINSLNTAKENNIKSMAFSAIGTGTNSFPVERAAEIAMTVIWKWYVTNKDCPRITIAMTSESKMQIYKKHFLLNVIKTFKDVCAPENLAFLTAHTLPYLFEECGGFTELPEAKKEQADRYREKYHDIHMMYSDYMDILYRTIGSPNYDSLINSGLSRVNEDGEQNPIKKFMNHLDLMQFDECVCFIVFLQRMDYASGGADSVHLKNCMNGNVTKVLNHMENMLIPEKCAKSYTVGETLFLGKYSQENCEDNSPIEWIILDIFEENALLISKHAIIPSGYCNPDDGLEGLKWANSLARKVCNNDFYNKAFNNCEKQIICKRITKQPSISNLSESITCEDNVFLLTETEATKYFINAADRLAKPTEFSKAKGCRMGWCGFENYTSWWIMPHYEQYNDKYTGNIYPKAVFHNGDIQYHSRNAYHTDFTIRPCIQINLEDYKKLIQSSNA